MQIYRTRDGDMVDAICYRHYGQTFGKVESVLAANPHLAEHGPVLEAGIRIKLPDLPKANATANTIRLWD